MAQRERSAAAPRRADNLGALRTQLRTLVEPVISAAGLDLEELGISRAGRRHVVRITVDGDNGVGHDELTDVSHRLSAALDEAEATDGDLPLDAYTLEVTSPGVDRPLTHPRHWRRNVGRLVTVRAGQGSLTARIADVTDDGVSFAAPGPAEPVPFEQLGPGRVQVEFTRLSELSDEDLGPEFDEADDSELADFDDAEDDGEDEQNGDARSELEDRA
jgi:ribosome maturation factor RimP